MPLKICYDNQADLATVSEENSTLQLPPSNVQDQRLSRIYQGGESINFDITGSGAPKTISQAYTNPVLNPNDWTIAPWVTTSLLTVEDSGQTINGNQLTRLGTDGLSTSDAATQAIAFTGSTSSNFSLILRNETALISLLIVSDGTATIGRLQFVWATKQFTLVNGISYKAVWIDDDTVQINITTDAVTAGAGTIQIYPERTAATASSILATEAQIIMSTTTMFPFVDGTHAVDNITETYTMPDRFTLVIKNLDPKFAYDTAILHAIFNYYNDATHGLGLTWSVAQDKFFVQWRDGGTAAQLFSQQFDDGSSFTDLNQKIDMYISLDLFSEDQNGSRFIVIPSSTDTAVEDTSFSAAPDKKESTFLTAYIGQTGTNTLQADSVYGSVIMYEGLLIGVVTNSATAEALVADKKVLMDLTYYNRLTATDLLIANSTINDGDVITLRGNDWDSFGTGTPVDESVTWSKDIIKHTFTKGSYQYWRLSVNSSNDISIGRLSLGPCYNTPGIAYLIPQDVNSATKKTYGVAGQAYGDKRYFFDQVSARWPDLSEDEKDDLIEILKTVDISTPFFITYDKAGATLGTMYVTFDFKTLKITPLGKRNLYTATAKFREEVK